MNWLAELPSLGQRLSRKTLVHSGRRGQRLTERFTVAVDLHTARRILDRARVTGRSPGETLRGFIKRGLECS